MGETAFPVIDADRRRHGPYTAAGDLLELLVPEAMRHWPELVTAYDIEIRTAAPDLREVVPEVRGSIASELPKPERILVHAPRRTLRIANGLAEFVREHLTRAGGGPYTLAVANERLADPTDREFLGVLRRRVPAALLSVVEAPPVPGPWEGLSPEEHARRAAELEAMGRIGPRLGAIPYHRERAGDPGRALDALSRAVEWCFDAGCHDAVADLGTRALRFADPERGHETWWRLIHRTATALGALGREEAALDLFDRARRGSVEPSVHAAAAYSTAMLLVRHHDPARRDPETALGWINEAIAISTLLPDKRVRAFKLGFDLNGRALIEMRLGRSDAAAELVQQAIDLADQDLDPGEHPVHRLVLRANRAQLAVKRGELEPALADLDAVIAADPGYPDYYIDRGNLHFTLGRLEEAVADYETAMRAGPPFPEAYHNRAEARFAAGDHEGALADLGHALELDPEFVDALVNRAGLLAAAGDHAGARRDAKAGLAIEPGNPYLLCALGQAEHAEGRTSEARAAFDAALARDPGMATAWACRGVLAHEGGDQEAAIADLTRALDLTEDAAFRYHRALALRAAGREEEAVADLRRAHDLAPQDEDVRAALGLG
ncbi:tetratricopeptide (TPR) repeat protein [Thermocatellispora tengchongensis]|uniref:Tetratricopeptide (TPR) repeat protein n=1 Tax=Thermocatellispora tengchongensis TaxID=1073253 RepID=A0A840P279_9ACTN|nr:tetratricopeptide repeat protein [Thermocatellispora tengchongensis]MBB5131570.1 tetratricopeptide (TPR) repeat protein [Thermocatellispora tengchongensis]